MITVDDTEITLREFGYYIYEVEEFVQNQALLYDPENPKHWWNTHFSAGMDSQFVCDYAKKVAVNTCISDEIYYKRALSEGVVLSSAEEKQHLLLKGGTAINLTVFNLPRLSVDIDLDFIPNLTREETANERARLTEILKGYMSEQGYSLSDASRFSHSLDAFH